MPEKGGGLRLFQSRSGFSLFDVDWEFFPVSAGSALEVSKSFPAPLEIARDVV